MYYINRQNIKYIGTEHLDALKAIRNNFAEGLTKGLICFGVSCDYCPFTNDNNIYNCDCCRDKDSSVFKESSFNIKSNREDCIRELDKMIEEIKNKRGSDNMFRDIKVGDRVWDLIEGWGTVVKINASNHYPIRVKIDGEEQWVYNEYTFDGLFQIGDKNPRLFWDKIDIIAPEKPVSIYDILKEIKPIRFKTGERNLFLLWDNDKKGLIWSAQYLYQSIGVLYFDKEDIHAIVDFVRNKKVSKEEFFKAYNEVFYKE